MIMNQLYFFFLFDYLMDNAQQNAERRTCQFFFFLDHVRFRTNQ